MATKKSTPKASAPTSVPIPSTPNLSEVTGQLHAAILIAAPKIVKENIVKAEEGSYLHAKFLFEFAGLQAILPEPTDAEEESLARMLLRELENGGPDQAPS